MIKPPLASTYWARGYCWRRALLAPIAPTRSSWTRTAPCSINWLSASSVTTVPLPIRMSDMGFLSFHRMIITLFSLHQASAHHAFDHGHTLRALLNRYHAARSFCYDINAFEATTGYKEDDALIVGNFAFLKQAQETGITRGTRGFSKNTRQARQFLLGSQDFC